MNPTSVLDYTDLNEVLIATTLKPHPHPSQIHGLICGILCGNADSAKSWQEIAIGGTVAPETQKALQALYDDSETKLKEFLFELQLLLPPDTDSLQNRAEALTLWGQGFLAGLQLAQVPVTNRDPSEVTEAIDDLVEVAKMNYEEVVESDDDEEALIELIEYIRVAVIFIYQDLHDVETGEGIIMPNVSDRLQ